LPWISIFSLRVGREELAMGAEQALEFILDHVAVVVEIHAALRQRAARVLQRGDAVGIEGGVRLDFLDRRRFDPDAGRRARFDAGRVLFGGGRLRAAGGQQQGQGGEADECAHDGFLE
jgi:hypothetical protein